MYYSYGLHHREWTRLKESVIRGYHSNDLKLTYKQKWFLFEKLLQGKYNHMYEREPLDLENMKINDYVHHNEFGRGKVIKIFSNGLYTVKFEKKELPVMCDGLYVVAYSKKTKITKI